MQVHQPIQKKKKIRQSNAEKDSAVVILDSKDYIKKSERHLKNPKHYRHLEHNPTTVNNATVNKALIRFKDE